MAEPIVIDVIIRAQNRTDSGVKKASKGLDGLGKSSKQAQKTLRELAREKVMILLEAKDRLSPTVTKAKGLLRGITKSSWLIPLKVADYATRPIRSVLGLLTSVQGLVFGAAGAFGGLVTPMDISGDYEQTEIAFSTMLKSEEKAKKFLAEASEFANATPFEFPDLVDSSKLLLAFGFDPDRILPMLTTIGDTSSGLGAGAQGIDRITRALGQIQAKGRVLTEELMQLQEVGIPVNQILQEELGLTQEQVANIGDEGVRAEDAISGLLRGMEKRYGGMMENQSKTAKGLMSTISDTFQNTFMRSWGTGLWAGFKPGLERITDWLEANPKKVKEMAEGLGELGESFSRSVMGLAEGTVQAVQMVLKDPEWQEADFFEKVEIAWDRLIAEPFAEWWASEGKTRITETAASLGDFIGTGLNRGIMAFLGGNDEGLLQDGMSAGASFAEGFLSGFKPEKVGKAVLEAVGGIFKDSFFGGGGSSTSWFSTLLVGSAGLKGLGMGAEIGAGLYRTVSAINTLRKLFQPAASAAPLMKGTASAPLAGGVSSAGGLAVPALVSVVGAAFAMMGLGSAFNNLKRARFSSTPWEKERETRRAAAKTGLVAAGAGIGTIVAPGIGTAVGAGLGGLTAVLGGNGLASLFRSETEKVHEAVLEMGDELNGAVDRYRDTLQETGAGEALVDEYRDLLEYMNSAEFDETKAESVQKRMKEITEELKDMFPDLITAYEELNGLSKDRLDYLDQELDRMDEQAMREIKQRVVETKAMLPDLHADYATVTEAIENKQLEWENQNRYADELSDLLNRWEVSSAGMDDMTTQKFSSFLPYQKEAKEISARYGQSRDYGSWKNLEDETADAVSASQRLNDSLSDLMQQKADLEAAMESYYSGSLELSFFEAGFTGQEDFFEAAKGLTALREALSQAENGAVDENLREMVSEILPEFSEAQDSAEQLGLLREAIGELEEQAAPVIEDIQKLNQELSELPEEKKIQITVSGGIPSFRLPSLTGSSVEKHAEGGFVRGPQLSWIGEDGPEAVIPLSGRYRQKGLALYEQAGKYLGVGEHAEGDFYSGTGTASVIHADTLREKEGSGGVTVQVEAPVIQVQMGASVEEALDRFRNEWSRMGDQVLAELAHRLSRARENAAAAGGGL